MPTPLQNHAQKIWQQGLDLLFPPLCVGCQNNRGHLLCPPCLQSMQPFTAPFCQHCGSVLATQTDPCVYCQQHYLQLHGLRWVHFYDGALRNAIHALKYGGQLRLAQPLGLLMARAFRQYHLSTDIILPLPLDTQRQEQRGYNHATLLARACATHLKVPCLENIIIRQRITRPQVGLNARERRENVAGAFACAPGLPGHKLSGQHVLLVDDVTTTGATLEACAVPLYNAGVKEVWGLVLCRPGKLVQNAFKGML